MTEPLDPVCAIHGKRMSEHDCLYCCICFEPLTPEECHVLPNGKKENVCKQCAKEEKQMSTTPTPNERDREVAANVILNLSTIWSAAVSPNLDNDMVARFIASYRAEIEAAKDKESDAILKSNERLQTELVKRFEHIRTLEKALSEAESAMSEKIGGKSFARFLNEQFPATIGNIQCEHWLLGVGFAIQSARAVIEAKGQA